ncbi:MAG: hypothetical protein HXS49_13925 [Theionarchaea archaeon]|nr:hypothetical protein [Theionarchaea archaeon]MBU7041934.1 hypothetical protein [Theionarchaea archaeon]
MFPQESVEFFYSPGHTRDSASCFDHVDHTLFVGDNLESPIPYLFYSGLDTYVHTLEMYQHSRASQFVPGHGEPCDYTLLQENQEYIRAFMEKAAGKYEEGPYAPIHKMNVEVQEEMKKNNLIDPVI